jgi:pilus assembly protein Flp/PilA
LEFFIINTTLIENSYPVRKEVNAMLFSPKEKGQGMVEYALIIVLIAIVVIVVLTVLGTQISSVFSQISSALGAT